ncbi:hypothetical protein EDB92DRAFT_1814002 [Lactarius akahatsu]|uniref:Uncharacterized protein n=1 Tax=Lactarius akahatsu TaxID=416441 RepID=A0AAD4QD94_9AGAM|nr:hypothetical protein EDB92DRAFT_1814002 [Lactarius akahatsu]
MVAEEGLKDATHRILKGDHETGGRAGSVAVRSLNPGREPSWVVASECVLALSGGVGTASGRGSSGDVVDEQAGPADIFMSSDRDGSCGVGGSEVGHGPTVDREEPGKRVLQTTVGGEEEGVGDKMRLGLARDFVMEVKEGVGVEGLVGPLTGVWALGVGVEGLVLGSLGGGWAEGCLAGGGAGSVVPGGGRCLLTMASGPKDTDGEIDEKAREVDGKHTCGG